ncbi:hypothetical protein K2V61_09015 [Staphylococcus simulans]|uniref:hypothetical protein n=1 Tax=Staphylococcus simulans TaxID=1286 RepID=UPI001E54D097|nr:hypothetical protein [Staphylococcus simulans]MCD8915682.1 hypothetical protein [Staphylococcus simulans]
MSQSLQSPLLIHLLDLSDEVKAELSELNQQKENVTKGPDYKLFERGIQLAVIQGKRQMIHALEIDVQAAPSDAALLETVATHQEDIAAAVQSFQPQHTAQKDYYNEGLALADFYETQGKAYIIQSIGAKIKAIQSEDR